MTSGASLLLLITAGALVAIGLYLMTERPLSRIVIGSALVTNGVNLLILSSGGPAGRPPFVGSAEQSEMADPLPQALILTAIVISLGMTAFVMAMAYRSWQLNGHDEVQDDLEDRRVAQRAATDEVVSRAEDDSGSTVSEDAAKTRDETAGREAQAEADRAAERAADAARSAGTGPATAPDGPATPAAAPATQDPADPKAGERP